MVTLAIEAAMIGPIYPLREKGAQHGGCGFNLRLSTFQGSSHNYPGWYTATDPNANMIDCSTLVT